MNRVVQRHADSVTVSLPLKTTNPNNGATGNSRIAGIIKARTKKAQRRTVRAHLMAVGRLPCLPVRVLVTRVAPSKGLDKHDGLGASLKSVIDGVADALGLDDDSDERVEWVLSQRRGPPRFYGVEIRIERVRAERIDVTVGEQSEEAPCSS